jgi:hypothetical protein
MKQRPKIYYTESQKALMWERWQKGDTLHQIAQLFDRHHPSIAHVHYRHLDDDRFPAPNISAKGRLATLAKVPLPPIAELDQRTRCLALDAVPRAGCATNRSSCQRAE